MKESAEEIAVFRAADGLQWRSKQPDVVAFKNSRIGQGYGQVQPGLPSKGGKEAVGPLPLDDSFQNLHGQRLDVDVVCDALVGHDGGGVGIDQDGFDSLLTEGLARLGAGVVEFGCLANDNRTGAYHQDLLWSLCYFGPP